MFRGAFVEGLYLSIAFKDRFSPDTWNGIVEQQYDYLENMRKLKKLFFRHRNEISEEWKLLEKCFPAQKGKARKLNEKAVKKLRKKKFS